MSDFAESSPVTQPAEYGPMNDKVYGAYQDQRNKLFEVEQEYARRFDKYLITLSGGALGVSLTFIRDIVPSDEARWLWMLFVAWSLLLVTIVLVLVMIRYAQDGHEEYRTILDEECEKGGQRFWRRVLERQGRSRTPVIIGRLNKVSLVTFGVAVVLLFVFTLFNLAVEVV